MSLTSSFFVIFWSRLHQKAWFVKHFQLKYITRYSYQLNCVPCYIYIISFCVWMYNSNQRLSFVSQSPEWPRHMYAIQANDYHPAVNFKVIRVVFLLSVLSITKTNLFKYTENFTTKKWKFSDKKFYFFLHISALNIHCGYSLEPPRRGGSNKYPQSMVLSRNKQNNVYPCKPQFYYIKVRFKEVKII